MLKGKTKSGFEFEIDEKKLDDMEYIDDMAEAEAGSPTAFSRVLKKTLGEEERKRFYDHLKNEEGVTTFTRALEEFTDLMTVAGSQTKNS